MSSGMNVRVRLLGGLCQPRGQRSALGGGRRHRESFGSSLCFPDTGEGQVALPSLAPLESVIPAVATAAVATVARFHGALTQPLESFSHLSRKRNKTNLGSFAAHFSAKPKEPYLPHSHAQTWCRWPDSPGHSLDTWVEPNNHWGVTMSVLNPENLND